MEEILVDRGPRCARAAGDGGQDSLRRGRTDESARQIDPDDQHVCCRIQLCLFDGESPDKLNVLNIDQS